MPKYRFAHDITLVFRGDTARHFLGDEIDAEPGEAQALVNDGHLVEVTPTDAPETPRPAPPASKRASKQASRTAKTAKKE